MMWEMEDDEGISLKELRRLNSVQTLKIRIYALVTYAHCTNEYALHTHLNLRLTLKSYVMCMPQVRMV